MSDSAVIFQRTHSGREEIQQKSHGLTQSERLVLIMIDGVMPCGEVRTKLSSLTDERFLRALRKLQQKELIVEIFMPVEGQEAEQLDKAVVERFLHQDPLDPVTIIVADAEQLDELAAHSPVASAPKAATPPPPAIDIQQQQLADSLGEELRARRQERAETVPKKDPLRPVPSQPLPPMAPRSMPIATPVAAKSLFQLHWGYWLIAVGFAFIVSFALARLLR